MVWRRAAGASWMPDTNGLGAQSNRTLFSFSSDAKGNVYLSTYKSSPAVSLYRHDNANSTWIPDTLGLALGIGSGNFPYRLVELPDGTQWLFTYNAGLLIRSKSGDEWKQVPRPADLKTSSGQSCFVLTADKNGIVWTQWSMFNELYQTIGEGVFTSTNHGQSWTSVPFDTVTFRQFLSVGDSVYGLSYQDGLFSFPSSGIVNPVADESQNQSIDELLIQPQPATDVLNIQFSKDLPNSYTLRNVLGTELRRVELDGRSQATVDLRGLCTGCYTLCLHYAQSESTHSFIIAR